MHNKNINDKNFDDMSVNRSRMRGSQDSLANSPISDHAQKPSVFDIFWADQLAEKIINRKKYRYLDKEIEKPKEFVVKTAASLSGVLHIGRLSDTIRNATVHRALLDAEEKSKLIWISDDMDPLRKIPQGVPAHFDKYIGSPVSMTPDPEECHESYAKHFLDEYLKVIKEFVFEDLEIFSMTGEYKKGNFKPYIKKLTENVELIQEIQNKHRTNPLKKSWNPWNPVCENCGKIITTKITDFDEKKGTVSYICKDYEFETTTAKGCGNKGENNPSKDFGKLAYKSEGAAQWARWNVSCEGWGKEYQVPNSAFWINAEICEKVLDFPSPEAFFYEHIMIDNQKMSASIGNVVYPKDWLEVAPPELLRLFYNKRLMTTRSFSWRDLPNLYDDYDKISKIYSGVEKIENKKEESHYKRLFEVSHGKETKKTVGLSFSHAAVIAQIFSNEEDAIKSMEKTGHYDKEEHDRIFERLHKAKTWLKKYAPDEIKFEVQKHVPKDIELTAKEKKALHEIAELLKVKEYDEKTLFNEFYAVTKELDLNAQEFFRAAYKVLLNKDKGPKLAPFILALGKEKVVKLFEGV